jgi:hypothetical protein
MSMLAWISSITCNDKNNTAKTLNTLVSITYFAVFVLAIFLAIRDMNSLDNTASKVWLFLFAIFAPELYVIIHGLSSSSMGVSFFAETPVEVAFASRGATPLSSAFPTPSTDAHASNLADRIKTAGVKLHSQAADALSSLGSTL